MNVFDKNQFWLYFQPESDTKIVFSLLNENLVVSRLRLEDNPTVDWNCLKRLDDKKNFRLN